MGKGLLIMMGGLVVVTSFIQVNNREQASALPERNTDFFKEQAARNVASSLVDNAIEIIKNNNEWAGTLAADDHIPGDGNLWTFTQNSNNLPEGISVGNFDEYTVLLYSESDYQEHNVSTEVLLRKDSFSKYSYFTEGELGANGQRIYFNSNDVVNGPVHTNGIFSVAGNPVFNGFVSSPNDFETHPTIPTDPEFLGGTNFNSVVRESPSSYEISRLATAAEAGGLSFDAPIDVQFITETSGAGVTRGKAKIREYDQARRRWNDWVDYNLDDYNGVIASTDIIYTKGEVKGNVSLYSEDDIEIYGDITYHTNPLDDPSSTDLLGIVSQGNVRIDQNAHRDQGTQDVNVHASILALNSSFEVENYFRGGAKGSLNLLGGIIQKNRGPVGTFSSSGIVSGFSKAYEYDERLRQAVPPFFPRESVFSIVYWKERTSEGTTLRGTSE